MNLLQKLYSRSYPFFKYLGRDIKGLLGLDKSFFKDARGSRIIIYHGVCQSNPTRFNSLFITRETFISHLKFYKKYFNVVSLDDLYAGKLSDERFNVCLSFDDGFANNHKYVLPLLDEFEIPATFFITGIRDSSYDILWNDFLAIGAAGDNEKINSLKDKLRDGNFELKKQFMEFNNYWNAFKQKPELEDYWMQMTKEEIRQLSLSPFVTIGSHSYWHNDLTKLTDQDLQHELISSKAFLEHTISKPVRAFAFPYGSYSEKVVQEALKAGYYQLLTTEFNQVCDKEMPELKERMGINPYISVRNQMIANVKGHYA